MHSSRNLLSPAEWKNYYRYSSLPPQQEIQTTLKKRHYSIQQIHLRYEGNSEHEDNFTFTLYETHKEGRVPTVLISPIFRGVRLGQVFAHFFARRGMNAVIVHQDAFKYDFNKNFGQIEAYLRKAIIRNLKSLDWIAGHSKTDPEKIGTFGISFGAIIGSVVAALDSRPKCHVIALAGAPVAQIIAGCRNPLIFKLVRMEARRKDKAPEDLVDDILPFIKSDPLHFASHVRSENIAMYVGLFDRVVRPSCARRLWEALGRPRAHFVPFGHYTSILSFPYAGRLAYRFYQEKLNFTN